MKCATLTIANLGVGLHLIMHVLSDADKLAYLTKDNVYNFNLNWRSLISLECIDLILSNNTMTQLFAETTLTIGMPILKQILDSLCRTTHALETNYSIAAEKG
jgi:hypothetical protein